MIESITQFVTQSLAGSNVSGMLFLFAFLGGVLSSVSPCSLGLLPVVIGYVGSSEQKNRRLAVQIFFFILGLSLVMAALGVIAAMTGQILGSLLSGPVYPLMLAFFILLMGLHLAEIIEIPMPSFVKQMPKNTNNNLVLYPMLVGAAFALATTPCSTPILAGIMAFASLKANLATGAILLLLFSLGQGMILFIAGLFTNTFKKMLNYQKYSHVMMKSSGAILIMAAVFIVLKVFGI